MELEKERNEREGIFYKDNLFLYSLNFFANQKIQRVQFMKTISSILQKGISLIRKMTILIYQEEDKKKFDHI